MERGHRPRSARNDATALWASAMTARVSRTRACRSAPRQMSPAASTSAKTATAIFQRGPASMPRSQAPRLSHGSEMPRLCLVLVATTVPHCPTNSLICSSGIRIEKAMDAATPPITTMITGSSRAVMAPMRASTWVS